MQNNTDKLKLLELTRSESDTDSPQFSIPKRKVRFKKRFRPNSKAKSATEVSESCSCQCVQHARLVLNIVLFIVVAILIWFITNLNTKVEGLQKLLNDLETGNKNMPEEFHDIHNGLQMLGHNVTSLGLELSKASGEIQAISAEVKSVKQTTEHLRASIAAAPEIESLPKAVHTVTEALAKIGSKITVVESDVKGMKSDQDGFSASISNIQSEIVDLKKKLNELISYVHNNLTVRVDNAEQAIDMAARANGIEETEMINGTIREDLLKHIMGGVTLKDVLNCNAELKKLKASVEKLNTVFGELRQATNLTATSTNDLLQQPSTKEGNIDTSTETYQKVKNVTNS